MTRDQDQAPLSEPLEAVFASLQRRWMLALFTPLAYVLVGTFLKTRQWLDHRPGEANPWDGPLGWSLLGGVGATLAIALAVCRRRQRIHLAQSAATPGAALRRWAFDFHVLAALADALAFLGLAAWAATGRSWLLLAGGALAYVGYAVARPRRSDLTGLNARVGLNVNYHA